MDAHREAGSTNSAKSVRMEQRTTPEAKELIEAAAGLVGVSGSEFTVSAAVRAARETLKEYHHTIISRDQHEAFIRALDATEPTADLKALMALEPKAASK
jgi:uncharacterized protein (DUF1778 family)